MDTYSFIVYIKTDIISADISKDVETRSDTSNYELYRPLLKAKDKNVIGLIKDELDEKIMREFAGLRAKTYIYLTNSNEKDNKAINTKQCLKKLKLKFKNIV